MDKQCFSSFTFAGLSLTEFGLEIPSPYCSLYLENSQITSATQWTLTVVVGGDDTRKVNIAAFEALLYSAAQDANSYSNSSGIPVSFMFGWLDSSGNVSDYISYQGFTLQFTVSTSGLYMKYEITGYATLAVQSQMPVLNIPELSGIVQPSAVVEALYKATKADYYYDLDIDHNDAPTFVNHGQLNTSFNAYVRGTYSGTDDYDTFPGLLKLSKSYNAARDVVKLKRGVRSLSQLEDCLTITPISTFLEAASVDTSPQCSSFSYWVDEPTMTSRGVIHYKSNASLSTLQTSDTLRFGTPDSNILTLTGSYNGVAYNMTDMNFKSVGFDLDGSGNAVTNPTKVVRSWSSSLTDVFQTVNIINDVNAIASQFSGDFQVAIPGSTKAYEVAQPVSLLVMAGNTLSPVTGVYSIMSVSHSISTTFITTLKLQRLVVSSANEVASSQGIYIRGSGSYQATYQSTSNIISTSKVDFGQIYPDYTYMTLNI